VGSDLNLTHLKELLERATKGPWAYRPDACDDWGFIRQDWDNAEPNLKRPVVAISRGGVGDDHDAHRRAGTDPYRPNGELIVAAVNALPDLIQELEAAQQRVVELEKRLEIPEPPFEAYDGIDCRDETIRGLDTQVDRLRSGIAEAVVREREACAKVVEEYVCRTCGTFFHPSDGHYDEDCPEGHSHWDGPRSDGGSIATAIRDRGKLGGGSDGPR
jgi:hypothetical protein